MTKNNKGKSYFNRFITVIIFTVILAIVTSPSSKASDYKIGRSYFTMSDSVIYKKLDSLMMDRLIQLKIQGEDSLIVELYDSLQIVYKNTLPPLDSLKLQDLAFPPKVYTAKELRLMEKEKKFKFKDSVIRSLPRILDTYVFADSIKYKRMFLWQEDSYFNRPKNISPDTSFNRNYSELPFQKNDAGATTLGVSGSAVQYHNYFKREENSIFPFFSPYISYSYTPETIPFYNVKTPYTELAYWGTLFANKQKEESNVKFLHTQNLSPSFNFNILYQRFGAKGMLDKEATDDRTFAFTVNHLGKRYVAQGGYIFNSIKRTENGGVSDRTMVMDTTLDDPRVIPITLKDANTKLKKNTFFITHSYGVPLNIFAKRDSLGKRKSDTLGLQSGTVTYFGHTAEVSIYSKSYKDNIDLSDTIARKFYNNNFFINPTTSADSSRVMKVENRFFISVQPWSENAIVSKVDAGVGYQYLSLFGFNPQYFLEGNKTSSQNNLYMYFGASGKLKKYFSWEGLGIYNFAGYYQNDFSIDGKVKFSSYAIEEGIHLSGRINIALNRPNYFFNNYYSNHYKWNNDFSKTSETKIEAKLEIPKWKLEAFFGYSLLNNNIYLDDKAIVRQNNDAMSIMTAYLQKNFKAWKFHFDNKVLFQLSSKEEVVALPKLSLNLRYYLEFFVVKNVLCMQLGANAIFNTKYYSPGYSPALGLFYNQRENQNGENPYIDVFVNLQWKRASIFVKLVNAAQNWPGNDRFSADRYLMPARSLKFGIHWPFYIK